MNTITRQTATDAQLQEIYVFIGLYALTMENCVADANMLGIPVAECIKKILGLGIKSAALAKWENMKITDLYISFDVWLRVNVPDPALYYKVNTHIDLETGRVDVMEYDNE